MKESSTLVIIKMTPVLLHWWSWLMLTLTLAVLLQPDSVVIGQLPHYEFRNEHGRTLPFQHMVVDRKSTNRIYIGGVNNLYELTPDMKLKRKIETGPREDSKECPGRGHCEATKSIMNAYNKALAIYDKKSQLVECSSLYQGRCRLRKLYNITNVIGNASQAIVANDEDSSSVVFVGPGPPHPQWNDVLYVGSTYTDFGTYRDEVPTVASLSLNSSTLFKVAHRSINTETRMFLERSKRKSYKIDYVTGFTSGNFSYFVTRQPKIGTGPSEHISKLVRLCHADKEYYSYTEIPLVCKQGSTHYNLVQDAYVAKPGFDLAFKLQINISDDVLYVVFSEGTGEHRKVPSKRSALCVYSIQYINQVFMENIQICNQGKGIRGLDYFKTSGQCKTTNFPAGYDVSCGIEVNYPLGGSIPAQRQPAYTVDHSLLTSVAASSVHQYSVVFMGTHNGRLIKGVVEDSESGFEYDRVEISQAQRPILPDMEMDMSSQYLLLLSEDVAYKIRVDTCEGDIGCRECLAARNPYCGWCSLKNVCVIKDDCQTGTGNGNGGYSPHWKPYKDAQCTTIQLVRPDKIQITSSQYLRLTIDNLPELKDDLSCVFTVLGRNIVTGVTKKGDRELECPTPPTNKLPLIPTNSHRIEATLAVQVDPQGPDLAQTNFTFFDCSTYRSCSGCVESPFSCDWCAESHQCTHNAEDRCRNQHIVNGVNRAGPSNRRGPDHCPRITSSNPLIYVPSGHKRVIDVTADNLLEIQAKKLTCQFKMEHSLHYAAARRLDNIIQCDPFDFIYYSAGNGNGTSTVQFDVLWGEHKRPLDNPRKIRMMMYKCTELASNCGMCVHLKSIERQLKCGWCGTGNSCTTRDDCTAPSISSELRAATQEWRNGGEKCANPKITSFTPTKGAIEGGTLVTIKGINLGRSFADVRDAIRINNVLCSPIESLYKVSSEIGCVSSAAQKNSVGSGTITIKLGESWEYLAISKSQYYFVDPEINAMSPVEGPLSGGTDVTVRGENLDAGSNVTAMIAGFPCLVLSRSDKELVCRTTASTAPKSGGLKMTFDLAKKSFLGQQFQYKPDPKVGSISTGKIYPGTIVDGGNRVVVRGDRFAMIQRPRMYVIFNGRKYMGDLCEVKTNEEMYCRTPQLQLPPVEAGIRNVPRNGTFAIADYGFLLDDVKSEANLSTLRGGFAALQVYQNPIIYNFQGEDQLKYLDELDSYLTINGQYIEQAAMAEYDMSVSVGDGLCNISAASDTTITCKPPAEEPKIIHPKETEHPEVVLRIGNAEYLVGYLSYDSAESWLMPMQTMIAIALAITVFILAIVCLLIAYRRKSTRHSRQMKNLKSQMDSIEMKVASECKEAFAELQTSLNNPNTGEMNLGIPFLTYRDYATQVLFPNAPNHPVLRELEVEPERAPALEKGLRQFNQLLMNKTFLILFVRTLESNKYFQLKDRVYVGSLLMVILQEKMEYCTDILKTLLAELIHRTAEKKFQPKILFRRSESIAERMLAAWFTFLMHPYLLECAGQPLFALYWAIKQQIEKGPLDAITLEARYSLSEEKLLRQSVEFNPVTIFVSGVSSTSQPVEVPVRVLDCDSITQVKEKCLDALYRTTPYSLRPSANDLDIEWRTGVQGRLALQDIDSTTRTEQPGGWKRLNTLSHYKVPPNAQLSLVHRQASMYNLSMLSERSDKSSTFSLKNSPTLNRAFSPLTGTTNSRGEPVENGASGYKVFHLVKPSDHSQSIAIEQERAGKMVSEIYLTRLLTTKGTLQKFMEDLFETIFSTAHRGSTLPLAIKYMFDFMDEQAALYGYSVDPDVVHTWKSNALPLRFWVNLIKNPHFIFDIPRLNKVEGCLSVVAQTLMDACSTQDHQLTKDSPSSKLLFARDILIYREWVDSYYQDIELMQGISDQDMNAFLAEESRSNQPQFHVYSALHELYQFVETYRDQLGKVLEEEETARQHRLSAKFNQMLSTMQGENLYGSTNMNTNTNTNNSSSIHIHQPVHQPPFH